jgi:ankyrin repeat protein
MNMNMNIWQDQMTPLHFAAANGKLDVAQLLVQSGANIEAQNYVRGVGALEWH